MTFIFIFTDNHKSFQPLYPWADRMQGARQMLVCLNDNWGLNLCVGTSKSKGGAIYHKAIYDWLVEDLGHIDAFLAGIPLRFYDHQLNSKGKLINCSVKLDEAQ